MRTVFGCCERAECGEEEKSGVASTPCCLPAVVVMAYILAWRRKKSLVQQTVRICEGWKEMEGRRKVKAKNETNKRTGKN